MNNPLDPTLRELNDCGCCAGTGAETPVAIDNRPGLGVIAFRAGTQPQFKASLLAALSCQGRPALAGLRTRDDDDFSVALLDGWAMLADVLTFYSERIANEGYLRTATERRSVLELARAIGYELTPGVAASTWLAFTVDDAKGTPGFANIARGTKVQSLPGPDEKPQVYETTEAILGRHEWNELHPARMELPPPHWGQRTIRLKGTTTRLAPGDALLIVGEERIKDSGSENWDFRRVSALETFPSADPEAAYTLVTLDRGLGKAEPFVQPAQVNVKVFALRQRLNVFGYNAPDWRTLPKDMRLKFGGAEAADGTLTPPEWPGFTLADIAGAPTGAEITTLQLEGTHPEVVPGSWLVVSTPGYDELYEVTTAAEDAQSRFTLNAKTTHVGVKGENLRLKFNGHMRAISVFAQSEELPRAASPVLNPVTGDAITVERALADFPAGRLLLVRGAPAQVRVTRAGAKLELTLTRGGSLPLAAGQLLTLLREPVLQAEAAGVRPSWLFSGSDFAQVSLLVASLRNPADPLAQYVWQRIPAQARRVLLDPDTSEQQQQFTLAQALSQILRGGSIYAEQRFAAVKLHPETLSLEAQRPQGSDLIRLNRWLLEDAYPRLVAASRTLRWELQAAGEQTGFVLATRQQLAFAAADPTDQLLVEATTVQKMENSSDGLTRLLLAEPLLHVYDPSTVTIFANVAPATHGETVNEILGGGDATQPHQRFVLKQKPLTYTPAANPSGGETSLEIWVNDAKWREVPSLVGRGPRERVYVTRPADDGTVSVVFGDGASGARLPTGQENVRAVYRKGIGLEGLAKAEQLSLLMTRPLGVKSVLNPRASHGAADPQKLSDARRNAPLTVLTLDRVVSLQDYEDFARGFSGIAKALATWTWNVQARGVFITVAGPAGAAVADDSATRAHLLGALGDFKKPGEPAAVTFGNPLVPVQVKSYTPVQFRLKGTVYVAPDRVPEKVLAAVRDALKAAFSFEARSFGQPVALSEVESVMQNVPGVVAVDIDELDKAPSHRLRNIVTAAKPAAGAAADQVQPAELLTLDETALANLVVKSHELRR